MFAVCLKGIQMFLVIIKLPVVLMYPTCSIFMNHVEQYEDKKTLRKALRLVYSLPTGRIATSLLAGPLRDLKPRSHSYST